MRGKFVRLVHHNHRRAGVQTVCVPSLGCTNMLARPSQHSASDQIALSYTLHARLTARCSAGSRNFNTFKLNSFRFRNNCFSSRLVCVTSFALRPTFRRLEFIAWKFAEVTAVLVKILFVGGGQNLSEIPARKKEEIARRRSREMGKPGEARAKFRKKLSYVCTLPAISHRALAHFDPDSY